MCAECRMLYDMLHGRMRMGSDQHDIEGLTWRSVLIKLVNSSIWCHDFMNVLVKFDTAFSCQDIQLSWVLLCRVSCRALVHTHAHMAHCVISSLLKSIWVQSRCVHNIFRLCQIYLHFICTCSAIFHCVWNLWSGLQDTLHDLWFHHNSNISCSCNIFSYYVYIIISIIYIYIYILYSNKLAAIFTQQVGAYCSESLQPSCIACRSSWNGQKCNWHVDRLYVCCLSPGKSPLSSSSAFAQVVDHGQLHLQCDRIHMKGWNQAGWSLELWILG